MPTRIGDLWLLTFDDRPNDIGAPLFSSRQIEGEIRRANQERRAGRTDWTAIDLEEVILTYVRRAAEMATFDAPKLRTLAAPGAKPAIACCARGCQFFQGRPCRLGRNCPGRVSTLF